VEVAQVRVRETCGAGCIEKVAAVLENGAEVVIWQGRHSAGTGIVDAAFSAPAGLLAHHGTVSLPNIATATYVLAGLNAISAVEFYEEARALQHFQLLLRKHTRAMLLEQTLRFSFERTHQIGPALGSPPKHAGDHSAMLEVHVFFSWMFRTKRL
jgi:hypothetical protein